MWEEPLQNYGGHIRVYDIASDAHFGAWYPDNARLTVPRAWFPRAQIAYEKLKAAGKLFSPTHDGLPPGEVPPEAPVAPKLLRKRRVD